MRGYEAQKQSTYPEGPEAPGSEGTPGSAESVGELRGQEPSSPSNGDEAAGLEPIFPTVEDATAVNQQSLRDFGQSNHALLRPEVLAGALARPQQHWAYGEEEDPQERLVTAAAKLAHGVGQAQAFEDGNKRTAFHLTHGFLHFNGLGHLIADDDDELAQHIEGFGEGTHSLDDAIAMLKARLAQSRQHQSAFGDSYPVDKWVSQGELKPFSQHNLATQKSIVEYLARSGERWPHFDDHQEYIRRYGHTPFGITHIPAAELQDALSRDADMDWPTYHEQYGQSSPDRGVPEGSTEVWPVFLDQEHGNILQDGYHRIHDYARQGIDPIPAVFFPNEPWEEGEDGYELQRQSNILDPVHEELDPTVWDAPDQPQPRLKHAHHRFIHDVVFTALEKHGYSKPEQWLSLVLTGSLTTYQYADHSDCDVSLFVNSEVLPEWSRAEMIGIMIEAAEGLYLPGTTHEMQFYVVAQGLKKTDLYKPGLRSGYDLQTDSWIVPPDRSRVHDVEHEMNEAYTVALENADKMEKLLRYEPEKAVMFYKQLHKRRMRDQIAGKGDFSPSNISYKMMANRGLFDALRALGLQIA